MFLKHGFSIRSNPDYPLYMRWKAIHARCYNDKHHAYDDYGGRGITIAKVWHGDEGFLNFVAWCKINGYKQGLDIDRKKNDKGYSPTNCRFISHGSNMRNRRNTVKVKHPKTGKTIALRDLYDERPRVPIYRVVADRIKHGWVISEALTKPSVRRTLTRTIERAS